eukprot:1161625-Pelagomonas_calceolata.AAC.26
MQVVQCAFLSLVSQIPCNTPGAGESEPQPVGCSTATGQAQGSPGSPPAPPSPNPVAASSLQQPRGAMEAVSGGYGDMGTANWLNHCSRASKGHKPLHHPFQRLGATKGVLRYYRGAAKGVSRRRKAKKKEKKKKKKKKKKKRRKKKKKKQRPYDMDYEGKPREVQAAHRRLPHPAPPASPSPSLLDGNYIKKYFSKGAWPSCCKHSSIPHAPASTLRAASTAAARRESTRWLGTTGGPRSGKPPLKGSARTCGVQWCAVFEVALGIDT